MRGRRGDATALGAALIVAGCQDGYPIAATRCDRWCDLTQATRVRELRSRRLAS